MRVTEILLLGAVLSSCGGRTGEDVGGVTVADVHRFVAAWKQFSGNDSTCAVLRPYWDSASPGLDAYREKFGVDFGDLCLAVHRRPENYAQLQDRLVELDSVASVVSDIYTRFDKLRPLENRPGVYLVVGTGISAGSTTRGRRPFILIGMERNRSSSGLPWLVAHELVHTQQRYPLMGALTGGPRFLRGSVLRHSIAEGSADFIAELVTGRPVVNAYAEAREAQIRNDFLRDAGTKEYGNWLYNGGSEGRPESVPADLGYWVGYRITKSYYERALDKQVALEEILSIRDFEAFLRSSGWRERGTLPIQ